MTHSALIRDTNWGDIRESLWTFGYARLGTLLSRFECEELRELYEEPTLFRSRIDMARYRFGKGEYKYFCNPLPGLVKSLREALYTELAGIANEWIAALSLTDKFPVKLNQFLKECHAKGQDRPTPLLLRYRTGDYNCLHQDLYGDIAFPFQVIFSLSKPNDEFSDGELMLVEQQPRAQSIGHSITLEQGEAVVITTRFRSEGSRGYYRTNFRHGVGRLLSGERYALGIIFHDAA